MTPIVEDDSASEDDSLKSRFGLRTASYLAYWLVAQFAFRELEKELGARGMRAHVRWSDPGHERLGRLLPHLRNSDEPLSAQQMIQSAWELAKMTVLPGMRDCGEFLHVLYSIAPATSGMAIEERDLERWLKRNVGRQVDGLQLQLVEEPHLPYRWKVVEAVAL